MIFTSAGRSADAEASRRSLTEGDEDMNLGGETEGADVTLAAGVDTDADADGRFFFCGADIGESVMAGKVIFGTTEIVEEAVETTGGSFKTVTPPEKATIKALTAKAATIPR